MSAKDVRFGEDARKQMLAGVNVLANAVKVRCVIVEGRGRVFWELNNPEDVARIESVLKDMLP